ncbi:hypothetical protein Scep_021410 [Stephania cephalantha]|uniref:Uncharacterized protein n=1 Tax=Stephania cephalantha TaxID=152367 RepID=A0AAP0I1E3_9MAGN
MARHLAFVGNQNQGTQHTSSGVGDWFGERVEAARADFCVDLSDPNKFNDAAHNEPPPPPSLLLPLHINADISS